MPHYKTPPELLEALQKVLPPSYFTTAEGKPRLLLDNLATSLTPEHSQVNYGLRWQRQTEQCELDAAGKHAVLSYKPEWTVGSPVANKPPHLLIRGDNYHALNALKHTHLKAIDVIYIDPPYNTGNKDFVYNDNFVDAEDGFKHSKWLSFMERRLKLAKSLLAPTGAIFISIDKNEFSQLKLICDSIFGEACFVEALVWSKKSGPSGVPPSSMVVNVHEYILCYSRTPNGFKFVGVPRSDESFSNPDNDPRGPWRSSNVRSSTSTKSFAITNPHTGEVFEDTWAHSKESLEQMIAAGSIIWPQRKGGQVRCKEYFLEFDNSNTPIVSQLGTFTGQGSIELLRSILGWDIKAMYPKPLGLLKRLLAAATTPNAVVLDFFAGSGTTAQAIIELNNEDGGSRQCIVATNDEGEFKDASGALLPGGICTNVTHPRISKVLSGYTNASGKEVAGLPGQLHAFDVTLTEPLPLPCGYDPTASFIKNYGIGLTLGTGFSHIVETTDKHIESATVSGDRLYILFMQGSFKKIQDHLKTLPFSARDFLFAPVSPLWPREHYLEDLPALQAGNLHVVPNSSMRPPSAFR